MNNTATLRRIRPALAFAAGYLFAKDFACACWDTFILGKSAAEQMPGGRVVLTLSQEDIRSLALQIARCWPRNWPRKSAQTGTITARRR